MASEKNTYYVSVGSREISQFSNVSPWDFKIIATDEEITKLREYFDQEYSSDWQGFWRAHVPYLEYHDDPQNDAVDSTNLLIYQMIYDLGDEEAKNHIRSLGLLKENVEKS
ncbi:hydrolase [Bacillus lacus]|uniref:Hydrolase n=1 Tax=Metabacillus lacus TaxID=1983721 RepID=A0A7X2M050_9BACI|nr:hydrolase [Metabacillus lacus]MRX72394.1 hydrolase [Metabacillus lacus]